MVDIKDAFKIGSKTTIANDCDLRGNITIGSGTVLHPRCTILALSGPIVVGSNCIVEENVVMVNRSKTTMVIGDDNLFQIGCRIESPSIGSHNVFGPRSRVSYSVTISSHCNIGPGCIVLPTPFPPSFLDKLGDSHSADDDAPPPPPPPSADEDVGTEVEKGSAMEVDEVPVQAPVPPVASDVPPPLETGETLPDHTIVFGSENRRRIWTGEGGGQARALHAKHLEYLQATLPKTNKLRMF